MKGVTHLILVAYAGDLPVAFKVGYQQEDYFYSWLGGVLPDYRRRGLAKRLAVRQESWARAHAYTSITFKTRNQHKNMLIFALRNGFDIIGFREKETIAANRILLRKAL
jgi:predicted GNAT superfamily acetyltransferase